MGKYIRLNEEFMEQARRDFEDALKKAKLSDGKFSFTKTFTRPGKDTATVYFTPFAWLKMVALIGGFDKEVAWHGVTTRYGDPENNEYLVSDIIVYPQEVTGATVNTDKVEYQTWLMSQPDEIFNHIRMQGHSHVNMGVSPSSVDINDQEGILSQLEDDMFYIFLICNKKMDIYAKIFDLAKNTVFETNEVTVTVVADGLSLAEFLKEAKDKVRTKSYAPAQSATPAYRTPYQGSQYAGSQYSQPSAQAAKKSEPVSSPADKKITHLSDGYFYPASRNSRGYYDMSDYYGGCYD